MVARFKDSQGNEWSIVLAIGDVQRVRRESNGRYDLIQPTGEIDGKQLIDAILDDPVTAWEVLWYLIEPQAINRTITAEKFGELMTVDCVVAATNLLLEVWADFFRQCQRHEMAQSIRLMLAGRRKLIETVERQLTREMTSEITAKLERTIEKQSGEAFSSLQASLALILPD